MQRHLPSLSAALRGERGYALTQIFLVIAVITALVLASAEWRHTRLRLARHGYAAATALSLAQSGVEATIASIAKGRRPEEHPLGPSTELTAAQGTLTVTIREQGTGVAVESCAVVVPRSVRASRLTRCVTATVSGAAPVEVLAWQEHDGR